MLEECIIVVTGRPRSGRRTSRCSQPAYLQRRPGLSVPQAGGHRKVRAASEEEKSEPSSEGVCSTQAKCFPALPERSCCPARATGANPGQARNDRIRMHMRSSVEPSNTNRFQCEEPRCVKSRSVAVTRRVAVHHRQPNSACFGQHCLTPRPRALCEPAP